MATPTVIEVMMRGIIPLNGTNIINEFGMAGYLLNNVASVDELFFGNSIRSMATFLSDGMF
jgi:hypothetical protein